MKLFQRKIYSVLFVFFYILLFQDSFSQETPNALNGDFGFKGTSGYNLQVSMKTVSVPFEGLTRIPASDTLTNRYKNIQAGNRWRYFTTNKVFNFDLGYLSKTANTYGMILDLGHCNGEEFAFLGLDGAWGFAKYQITVTVNGQKYTFYLNCLDSKYAQDISPSLKYSIDFYVEYDQSVNTDKKLIFKGSSGNYGNVVFDSISTSDTVLGGLPSKEFKVWEILLDSQSVPLEKNFFARTTPFPITPDALDSHFTNRLILGTKVVLDTVYYNFGANDKWGYNTVIDAQNYYDYYYYPPIINRPANNKLGETFTTPAWRYRDEGNNKKVWFTLNIQAGDSLILKKNKNFWVTGYNFGLDVGGDTLLLSPNSCLIKEQNAEVNLCFKGVIIDSGSNSVWSTGSAMRVFKNSALNFLGQNHTIDSGGRVIIDTLGNLVLGNNTTLTFEGNNTYLELKSLANVKLGTNAKIKFKNGAYLKADGAVFSGINQSIWEGLVFEDAGSGTNQISIANCTFDDLKNPIKISNTTESTGNTQYVITRNIFNISQSSVQPYGIQTSNAYNVTIYGNKIYLPFSEGIGLLMKFSPLQSMSSAASITTYRNIIDNEIYQGKISSAFIGLGSAYTQINYIDNICSTRTQLNHFVGRKISGIIKNNSFNSNESNCNPVEITQSIPDFLSNKIYAPYCSIKNYDSYPNLSPNPENASNGGWVWLGGKNTITSTANGNLYIYGGRPSLEWGQNTFLKNSSIYFKHIWGKVNELSLIYNMRNNCFNDNNYPTNELLEYTNDSIVIPYVQGSNFTCNASTDAGIIWQILDYGNGIKDTIYKTANISGTQPSQDEGLHAQAIDNMLGNNYFDAISLLKTLVNIYPNSSYTTKSIYELYASYEALDTSSYQNIRNIHYNNLKNFLDEKILSEIYSDEFNSTAYEVTLMCLAKMTEYNDAMTGYEFISLYHPDAYIRLLASWDYSEIEQLLNGSGGYSNNDENLTDTEYLKKMLHKVNVSVKEDPIKQIVNKSYKNVKTENEARIKKERKENSKNETFTNGTIVQMIFEAEKIDTKVISNIRFSKSLTKAERDKKQIDEILFTNKTSSFGILDLNFNLPNEYLLSQNYPNPFNPVTTIRYSIPKESKVSLIVYDITGREIKSLVNDLKTAGNYSVVFNGSSLASGIYFYRLKAANFVQTKKLVLVK